MCSIKPDEFDREEFNRILSEGETKKFELYFLNKYKIEYKDFLKTKLSEYSYNLNNLSIFLGIHKKVILKQLKDYSLLKDITLQQLFRLILSNFFVYALKTILAIIGTTPIFFYVGYLILYGYFFGDTDHSLLDVLIKSVPINRYACYGAGFVFSAFVLFWMSIFNLKKLGWAFILTATIYFIFCFSLSILYILFTANSTFISKDLLNTFIAIWFFPLLVAVFIIFLYYSALVFAKYHKSIIVSFLFSLFTFPLWRLSSLPLKWVMLICILELILSSLSLILLFNRINCTKNKSKSKNIKSQEVKKYTFKEQVSYIILFVSFTIVIFIPFTSFLLFFTGNVLGSNFSTFSLIKQENITVGNASYSGKLISSDTNYLYISTNTRRLLMINKDNSVRISSSGEQTNYTGNSANFEINLSMYYKDEELWYSGIIKSSSFKIKKITYSIGQLAQFTLDYSVPIQEIISVNSLNTKELPSLEFININWYSEDNSYHQERVQLHQTK